MVNQYSGGKPAHGNFKGFVANLTTPGQMIYKAPSGALSIIQKATRDYPDFVASRINTFYDLSLKNWNINDKKWNIEKNYFDIVISFLFFL